MIRRLRRLRLVLLVADAALSDFLNLVLGPRCRVTGERVFNRDRALHTRQHALEGPCT